MSALSEYFYKGPSITLNSGRDINIQRIDQYLTYAHILEGIPYGQQYNGLVDLHLRWAKQKYPNRKIIVLPPRLRELPLPEEDLSRLKSYRNVKDEPLDDDLDADELDRRSLDNVINASYRNREIVSIGSVCCRVLFESAPIDVSNGMMSELFVIWFQDGFCMPIDPQVEMQIMAIDWENNASDVDL